MYEQMDHTFSLNENLWVFTGVVAAIATVNTWHLWEKPKWCRGVFITAIGGGSGGGGGGASAAGVAAGGGGGGGNGVVSHCFFPATNIQYDPIYVRGFKKTGYISRC